jgi:hypothetical protein
LLSPILLAINLKVANFEGFTEPQFLFVTSFVAFLFNLVAIIRKNRIMPFLPRKEDDDRLKLAALAIVASIYFMVFYGWLASGGMLFAILWETLAGKQGFFYLIIFGGVIFGSITMELNEPKHFLLKLLSSILIGIAVCLVHSLRRNNLYSIVNQISLFVMIGSLALFPAVLIK